MTNSVGHTKSYVQHNHTHTHTHTLFACLFFGLSFGCLLLGDIRSKRANAKNEIRTKKSHPLGGEVGHFKSAKLSHERRDQQQPPRVTPRQQPRATSLRYYKSFNFPTNHEDVASIHQGHLRCKYVDGHCNHVLTSTLAEDFIHVRMGEVSDHGQ